MSTPLAQSTYRIMFLHEQDNTRKLLNPERSNMFHRTLFLAVPSWIGLALAASSGRHRRSAVIEGRVAPANLEIAAGPFKPTMDSLKEYQCPEWFRDAKFGIWAHWGPQAVPMDGDWYARDIYEQGSPHYKYHLGTTAILRCSATRTSSRSGRPRSGTPTA